MQLLKDTRHASHERGPHLYQVELDPCLSGRERKRAARQDVDSSVIALWLGHESVETTQIYFAASLQLKERALAKMATTAARPARFRPDDKLLAFLQSL